MERYRRGIVVILALVVAASLAVLPAVGRAAEVEPAATDWEVLLETIDYIQQHYLRDVDAEALWEGAIRGLLETLRDPYSEYLSPEAYRSFLSNFESAFGGVGMRVQKVGDYITVVAPLENTPAARAGIQAGDRIVAVDGQNVVGASLATVVELIRGEPGTEVVLEVLREGVETPLTFRLVREVISIPSLEYRLLETGIGYLRLRNFSENSGKEVAQALAALREQGARAFILDLRNNPGGLLSAAVEVAGQFLPSGTVVQVVNRDGQVERLTWKNPTPTGIVVVLMNRGSASASEIVAGALQDRGYGVLLGSRSFGKGTVQSLVPLSNGGALKLTTAEYILPSGRHIDQRGLDPDIHVPNGHGQVEAALALLRPLVPLLDGSEELGVTFVAGQPVAIQEGGLVALPAAAFAAEGVFYLPVRSFTRLFGADVLWNPLTRSTLVNLEGGAYVLTPGSSRVTGDTETFDLPAPVVLRDGRTYVPAAFLQRVLQKMVWFNQAQGSLKIY